MYRVKDKLDFGIAMSPTEEASESLGTFLPQSWIYNDLNKPAIERLMALAKTMEKGKGGKHVFLLLDDCMYDKESFEESGKLFRQLMMNGRHRRMFFLNCQQYCMICRQICGARWTSCFNFGTTRIRPGRKRLKTFSGSSTRTISSAAPWTPARRTSSVWCTTAGARSPTTSPTPCSGTRPTRTCQSSRWGRRFLDPPRAVLQPKQGRRHRERGHPCEEEHQSYQGDQDGKTVGPLSTVWESYD